MATYYVDVDTWTDDGVTYRGKIYAGEYHYWVVHDVPTDNYEARSPFLVSEEVHHPVCKACRYQTDEHHTEEKGCMFDSGWVED